MFFEGREVAISRKNQITWEFIDFLKRNYPVQKPPRFHERAITSSPRAIVTDSMPNSFGKGGKKEDGKYGKLDKPKTDNRIDKPLAHLPATPRFRAPEVESPSELLDVVRTNQVKCVSRTVTHFAVYVHVISYIDPSLLCVCVHVIPCGMSGACSPKICQKGSRPSVQYRGIQTLRPAA